MKYELLALLTDRPDDIDWTVLDQSHPAVLWVQDYYNHFGSLPTLELFAQECLEEGEKPIATAPWAYYVKEAKNVAFVKEAGKYLTAFNKDYADDPAKAILALRDHFAKLAEPTQSLQPADIAAQTRDRWKRFGLKQGARVKTGLTPFDEASGGLSPDDEFAVLSARLASGKALKYGTKVLSATGEFKPVEDFQLGDYLIGRDGKPTKIVGIRDFDSLNLYRVSFIDGTYIDCCEDHLWTLRKGPQLFTLDTKYLATHKLKDVGKGTGKSRNTGHSYHLWFLPQLEPVQFPEKQYVIPPYTLGALLGDGSLTTSVVNIASRDSGVVARIAAELHPDMQIREKRYAGSGDVSDFALVWKHCRRIPTPYSKELTRLGLHTTSDKKHIPFEYLSGSVEQRAALLEGILDTDGYMPGGSILELALTSERLIDDVRYLVESLGGYARKRSSPGYYRDSKGAVISTKTVYTLTISIAYPLKFSRTINNRWTPARYQKVRPIVSVEPIESAGGRCFIVDNEEHLFLTEHFIPTHNSFICHYMALEMAKQGLNVGLYSGEMSEDEVGARIDTWLTHVSNFDLTRGKYNSSNDQEQAYAEQVPGKILVLTPKHLGHPARPSDLRKFVKEQLLSVLLIDQLSLMQPDGKLHAESHSNFESLSMQLKTLQQELRIPIVAVSQLNRQAQQEEINAAHIAGSDRIGQDATLILGLEKKDNELTIKVLKGRSFKRPERGWIFSWDVDTGVLVPALTALDVVTAQQKAAAVQDKQAATPPEVAVSEETDFG